MYKNNSLALAFIAVATIAGIAYFIVAERGFQNVVAQSDSTTEVSPPDESFLDRPFNSCKVTTEELEKLTPAEKCWVEKLSKRCTPADDCLVGCLASTKARNLGGGCWHACFEVKFPISKWSDPEGADTCRKIPHD